MFNRNGGLAIVITVPNAAPVVILPTWSGTTLTIPYPNGTYMGLPIQITKVSLSFFTARVGQGRAHAHAGDLHEGRAGSRPPR